MLSMESTLVLLYSFVPLISLVSYLPQIKSLSKASYEEARGMSITSWMIWSGSSIISTGYAAIKVGDPLVIFSNAVCLACSVTIMAMLLYKQAQYRSRLAVIPMGAE